MFSRGTSLFRTHKKRLLVTAAIVGTTASGGGYYLLAHRWKPATLSHCLTRPVKLPYDVGTERSGTVGEETLIGSLRKGDLATVDHIIHSIQETRNPGALDALPTFIRKRLKPVQLVHPMEILAAAIESRDAEGVRRARRALGAAGVPESLLSQSTIALDMALSTHLTGPVLDALLQPGAFALPRERLERAGMFNSDVLPDPALYRSVKRHGLLAQIVLEPRDQRYWYWFNWVARSDSDCKRGLTTATPHTKVVLGDALAELASKEAADSGLRDRATQYAWDNCYTIAYLEKDRREQMRSLLFEMKQNGALGPAGICLARTVTKAITANTASSNEPISPQTEQWIEDGLLLGADPNAPLFKDGPHLVFLAEKCMWRKYGSDAPDHILALTTKLSDICDRHGHVLRPVRTDSKGRTAQEVANSELAKEKREREELAALSQRSQTVREDCPWWEDDTWRESWSSSSRGKAKPVILPRLCPFLR